MEKKILCVHMERKEKQTRRTGLDFSAGRGAEPEHPEGAGLQPLPMLLLHLHLGPQLHGEDPRGITPPDDGRPALPRLPLRLPHQEGAQGPPASQTPPLASDRLVMMPVE